MRGASRLSTEIERLTWGHADLAYPADMLLGVLRNQAHTTRVPMVATVSPAPAQPDADAVRGVVQVNLDRAGNTHLAAVSVSVDPAYRRQGIGSALLVAAEEAAAERGRTTVILDSAHNREVSADDPRALVPPTGSGRISPDDPAAIFALSHGYTLEQGERYSILHLPLEDPELVDRLHAEAAAAAGDAYRILTWTDRCPDELVDQYAALATRMSTAIPVAGLDVVEDPWDAARVRDHERTLAETGRGYVLCAAEHVATGELVAYTEIVVAVDYPEMTFQDDTLVLTGHRGHRLGMLLKTANLNSLLRLRPGTRRIHTWNAEENEHMLAINVALGFRPTGVVGLWQKKLD
ncbi:Acetyltransferase (GNAT) family protein [Sanguibacter gelidistatuariae]|uniref:Acetyltransferase (GNAT) family protein n=1 Tax=Sanguibacter gelidistatuariae TaxID=1814289 RepID=A0A1G6GPU8_9MICO|nr:GNAT family N-acetyltransferase [Sanguibacter gelidistatuariae]SDB83971.1 Acetyltransferase (GNAT) family protein [Sanguibacter gelidistatuariae]